MDGFFWFLVAAMVFANFFAFACFAVGGGDDS
jgi:hypothetical protein